MKTQRRPQNRKYITYYDAVKGGLSHDHRQHQPKMNFKKLAKIGLVFFELCEQTDRQTDRQTRGLKSVRCKSTLPLPSIPFPVPFLPFSASLPFRSRLSKKIAARVSGERSSSVNMIIYLYSPDSHPMRPLAGI